MAFLLLASTGVREEKVWGYNKVPHIIHTNNGKKGNSHMTPTRKKNCSPQSLR